MGRARQTFERRQLGLTLRRLREQAGKSQHAAAQEIGKARSRLVQIEDGEGTLPPDSLDSLLDLCSVEPQERETVQALAGSARKRQKRRAYVDTLPDAYQRFADLESNAIEIKAFEPSIVPGLLQSPSYIRSVIESWQGILNDFTPEEVEQRIDYRIHRQSRALHSEKPGSVRVVLSEHAITDLKATPALLTEQLKQIMSLLDEYENLSVAVLPAGTPWNPACGGGFTLFGFGEQGTPVAFSSVLYGPSVYLDGIEDTNVFYLLFDRIHELALDHEESRDFMERTLEEFF
ncbi:Helix-turn-helix domain-containing protein [Actinopolyspora mzabensis]|uniref:Helix-turn-helix domain-containing protein n=1 Tax=Actinopolyspora mzabensis TaxID=995066 RepID=A0A1G8VRB3_ACTMZ|nr:helix-turn-helix transcriptional regulator [Actinopolyspora mzabensis]SDJ68628.1 Helix-turn-helix domain-containing protein [Actinopolyspora mzabensis]